MAWGDRYKSNPFGYGGPTVGTKSWATGEEMGTPKSWATGKEIGSPGYQVPQNNNQTPQDWATMDKKAEPFTFLGPYMPNEEMGPKNALDDFDTSNLDPSDPEQVMELQRNLGITVDGMFGPKTEEAYRSAINSKRLSQGLDEYQYDTPGDSSQDSSQDSVLSRIEDAGRNMASNYNQSSWSNWGGEGMVPDYFQGKEGWIPDYFQGKEGLVPDAIQPKDKVLPQGLLNWFRGGK